MLEKYKYKCLILLHNAKWFYTEFYKQVITIALLTVALLILVAINLYLN